jgi:hypothetical protein
MVEIMSPKLLGAYVLAHFNDISTFQRYFNVFYTVFNTLQHISLAKVANLGHIAWLKSVQFVEINDNCKNKFNYFNHFCLYLTIVFGLVMVEIR